VGTVRRQIFKYDTTNFTQQLMTDGESKNQALKVSHDGAAFAYSSSLRNNRDWDVYVQNCDGSGKRMYGHGNFDIIIIFGPFLTDFSALCDPTRAV